MYVFVVTGGLSIDMYVWVMAEDIYIYNTFSWRTNFSSEFKRINWKLSFLF